MKYLVMIQARCGSTRLPNKVLKDLCGKPALQRMIERVQKSKLIDEVMVVTSIEKNNLPILKMCSEIGVRVGVGSEGDVLDRFYQTAKLLKPEYVIRLTADCPCFDADLLDQALSEMDPATDYMGMMSEEFADGLDLEIMKDFELVKCIYEHFELKEGKADFGYKDVLGFLDENPKIFSLNQKYKRNEGLEKSIKEDCIVGTKKI